MEHPHHYMADKGQVQISHVHIPGQFTNTLVIGVDSAALPRQVQGLYPSVATGKGEV